jgi:hypothetical protein
MAGQGLCPSMTSWSRPGSFLAKAREAERLRLSCACRVKPPCSRKRRKLEINIGEGTNLRVGHDPCHALETSESSQKERPRGCLGRPERIVGLLEGACDGGVVSQFK